MTLEPDDEAWERDRYGNKRDRTARLLQVFHILHQHGEAGVRAEEVGRLTHMSKRSAYRDIRALESELGMPLWNPRNGYWAVQSAAFLPPLSLTVREAMAVVLAARLMTRYADKYDPDLGGAFIKLAATLPASLRSHVALTLHELAERRVDEGFNRHVGALTRAWAERRVVRFSYAPASYDGTPVVPREAVVHPYLLEPSLATHALYLIGHDETRDAIRTFKVERIGDLSVLARTFEPPDAEGLARHLRAAWDMIADQPLTEVVLRFAPAVAARVQEATWHPTQRVGALPDGSLEWRAKVSGTVEIRLWVLSWGDDVEVLAPASLRRDVAATLDRAHARYGG
jgi:predicted DNA-binding transcriptional regulator YafY